MTFCSPAPATAAELTVAQQAQHKAVRACAAVAQVFLETFDDTPVSVHNAHLDALPDADAKFLADMAHGYNSAPADVRVTLDEAVVITYEACMKRGVV